MNELARAIAIRISEHGAIGFDEFVGHALYAPRLGFYTRTDSAGGGADARGAGRRRDFLTSPEVGPLFGAVLGRALDSWWVELGRPDPFLVVEAGAGPGTLARTILAGRLACADTLRLVLVEPGECQWSTHPEGVSSRVDLPEPGELAAGPVIVLANELLDNLPFGLVELVQPVGPTPVDKLTGSDVPSPEELSGPTWCEVLVDLNPGSNGEGPRFVERFVGLDPARQGWCWGRAGRGAAIGTRLPVQADAAGWLGQALDLTGDGGRVVAVDYASTTGEMARRRWTEWVRTYRRHAGGGHPLQKPGSQDITCEVAVDQLATVARPDGDRTQAEFLRAHGIDDLVADGRRRWAEQGIAGGLDAVAARSRVHEAEALTDPDGLGAFRVLEWVC